MCSLIELQHLPHAALFGVFDGHGGDQVSDLVSRILPAAVAEQLNELGDPREALRRAFGGVDQEIRNLLQAQLPPQDWEGARAARVGSTAVVTLLLREAGMPRRLFCANCGDSRAVLCRSGRLMSLSADHKPQHPAERARIEAAGGRVSLYGPCWRIDGGLNVSRTLGDFAYKARADLPSHAQKVICTPDVLEFEFSEDDEFIAIGSDGVFDMFSSEELVRRIHASLVAGATLQAAVNAVLEAAITSGDNVSLVLVRLLHGPR